MNPLSRSLPCIITFWWVAVLSACSGKPGIPSSDVASGAEARVASTRTAPLGKASFSALIDGERVEGGAVDELQQQNAAHTIPGKDAEPGYLLFYLFDTKVPDDPHFEHSMRLYLPKKLGAASDAHLTLNVILDADHVARYSTSKPDITISSLTPDRVSGTFQGSLTLSPDTPNAPKQKVVITEGRFDIPMATSKIIPP